MTVRRLSVVLDLDTGRYSGRLGQAGAQMQNFGGQVSRASQSVSRFEQSFNRMGSGISSPTQKLRDYVLILGNLRFAIMNVRDLAVGWVAGLVKQAGEVERLTYLMKGLSKATTDMGKQEEARRSLADLTTMARRTGIELNVLSDAFVKFKSGGLDPKIFSLEGLVNANAAFGGTSDSLHRASIAIQQMAGKGVVSMEELRQQLGEAIPNAIQLMADAMGKTLPALTKEIAKGTVAAKPALKALLDEMDLVYKGQAEKMAGTLFGQLGIFKTNVQQMAVDFAGLGKDGSLFQGVIDSFKRVNAAMQSQEGRKFMADLGKSVGAIATGLVNLVEVMVRWREEIGRVVTFAATAWGMTKVLGTFQALEMSMRTAGGLGPMLRQSFTAWDNGRLAAAEYQLAVARGTAVVLGSKQAEQQRASAARAAAADRLGQARSNLIAVEQQMWASQELARVDAERVRTQLVLEQNLAKQRVALARQSVVDAEAALARATSTANGRNLKNVGNDPAIVAARQVSQAAAAEAAAAEARIVAAQARIDAIQNNSALTRAQRSQQMRTALRQQVIAETEFQQAQDRSALATDRLLQVEQRIAAERTASRPQTAQEIAAARQLAVAREQLAAATDVATRATVANTTAANENAKRGMAYLTQAQQKIVLTEQLAAAETVYTAAIARETAATEANTIAKRAWTVATNLAGAAGSYFSAVINAALGPLGMIAMLAYQAASAFGVFETAADRATAAAERMRQGFQEAGDAALVAQRKATIAGQLKEIDENKSDPWFKYSDGKVLYNLTGPKGGIRDMLQKELDSLNKGEIQGKRTQFQQRQQQWYQQVVDGHNAYGNNLAVSYRREKDTITANVKDAGERAKQLKAAHDRYMGAIDANKNRGIKQLSDFINQQQARGIKMGPAVQALGQLTQEAESAQSAMADLGNTAGGKTGGGPKFDGAMASAAGQVAKLNAQLSGSAGFLAQFNAEVGKGKYKGWSEGQIAQMRSAMAMKDALSASKKSQAAGQSANDSFDGMLTNTAGKIAELRDELQGGQGDLAKFEAKLASGGYEGVSQERIDQMREYLKIVEALGRQKKVKNAMDGLDDELAKAKTRGDELWASFNRGTLEADDRLAQIKARFADKLLGLTGEELATAQAKIDQIVAAMQRADNVQVTDTWRTQAEEMRLALLDEDTQRELNFQRELARQEILLQSIRENASMSAFEKQRAESAFLAWKSAAEARDQRASESMLAKQARNWANLGQNIQQTMTQAIGSVIDGMYEANVDFGEIVVDIIKQLMKAIMVAMVAYAILSAIGMTHNAAGQNVSFTQFMRGQVGAGLGMKTDTSTQIGYGANGAMGSVATPKYDTSGMWGDGGSSSLIGQMSGVNVGKSHTGGLMGRAGLATVDPSIFASAKKYHGGGWIGGRQLRPGEVPIVGLDEELVLTKEQQRLLGQGLGTGGMGGMPAVQVNVINNSGQELDAEQGEPQFDGKDYIVNVVVEAAQKQGRLRDTFMQMGQNK